MKDRTEGGAVEKAQEPPVTEPPSAVAGHQATRRARRSTFLAARPLIRVKEVAMQTRFVCPGCTYTAQRRMPTCPMCGALMQPAPPDARRPVPTGGPFAAVPFVP